jgi:hypothetical protein
MISLLGSCRVRGRLAGAGGEWAHDVLLQVEVVGDFARRLMWAIIRAHAWQGSKD